MTSPLITEEIQKLAPSAIIELFELDTSNLGGDTYYFHAGTNELKANITWGGQIYTRFPIEATGFEFTGNGQLPRPKLRVSNILGTITALLLVYDDLLGAKLTRRRTLAKYLDAVNFPGGVNPTEDSTAEFVSDVFFIDRKSAETRNMVEFELAAAIDLAGVKLPKRQIIQNICSWIYRSSECGYTGGPLYDIQDQLLTEATTAEGIEFLEKYHALQAAKSELAVKVAALSAASQAKDVACEIVHLETRYLLFGTAITDGIRVFKTNQVQNFVDAKWDNSPVTLGTTYRMGALRSSTSTISNNKIYSYEIERWGVDSGMCTPATATMNDAQAEKDSAELALAAAQSDYDDALAALPENDPLWIRDQCGKRLSSCKVRFGENSELPYGAFPSAGLFG